MRWAKSSVISRFAPPAREILVRPGPSQFLQNYDFIFIAYLKTVDFEVLKSDLNASNFSSTFTNVLRISLHVPPKTLQRSKTFSLLNSYIYPLHSLVLTHTKNQNTLLLSTISFAGFTFSCCLHPTTVVLLRGGRAC